MILIIDDDAAIRSSLTFLMTAWGSIPLPYKECNTARSTSLPSRTDKGLG